jgi:type I restriction enzyme S subunit
MGHVTKKDLQRIRVRIPPLQEQRAIAHILGTLDDKIELNRRMSETLEAMARALFKAWFVDFEPVRAKMEGRWRRGQSLPGLPAHLYDLFPDRLVDSELGEIPEGWRVGRLGELSEKPQYGYTASAKEEPVGPKFLRITDINKLAWIDWPTVPYCEIEQEDFEQYRLHPGDVLIARMADPGHGVVIEEQVEAVFASYLIRFRLKDQAYIRYIQYWLRSDGYWELVTSRYAGTTRASLNAQVLSSFQLIIPPKPIASAFSEIVNALRNKVVAAAGESRTLAALRDALLPKLIRGEIRVKDAEQFLKERVL